MTDKRLKKNRCRKPSDIYEHCPACNSKNIYKLDVDVVCFNCDWNSTAEYVASGGMDQLITSYFDHFGPHLKRNNQ